MATKPLRECFVCHRSFRTYSRKRLVRCNSPDCKFVKGSKPRLEPDGLGKTNYIKIMSVVKKLSPAQQEELYEEARKKVMDDEV